MIFRLPARIIFSATRPLTGGVIFSRSSRSITCTPMKRANSETWELPRPKRIKDTMTTAKIALTSRESQLRNLLLDVARYIDESKEIKETIELRFAGGWVRDKLLGVQSHDIDTSINAMTGEHFCLKMKQYLEDAENLKKHVKDPKDVGNLHKIEANPKKSKHLETATTKIYGFDVDFVNLRKETYSDDSRNPQMEFGTAQEDAERRDATINALFYNLHSDLVEDFVGGLQDLVEKRIKTPLEPYTTFTDDPLRVLRLIRFASRLGFMIDPECEKLMSHPTVLESLKVKISRERVGIEVGKMLKANDPKHSLELFDRLGLYSTIFTDPTATEILVPATTNWHHAYECLDELKTNETPGSIYQSLVRCDDAKYISWILASLTPWSAVQQPTPAKAGGKALLPVGAVVAREGIKADNKILNVVAGAFRNFEEITELKNAVKNNEPYIHERDTTGMAIRRWETQGGHWRSQALFALLVDILIHTETQGREVLLAEWQKFIDHLESLDVMNAPSIKGIINGTQLSKALGVKAGVWMKPALDLCMAWQLRNPDATDPARAIEEVEKYIEALGISKA